jgi:hypothetical protein
MAPDRHSLLRLAADARADNQVAFARTGDGDDPLAGVVRLRASGERDVDVVVGRGSWEADILARAEPASYDGTMVPAVQAGDLILLKLFAGGRQDRWDIEQLLARPDRDALVREVDARVLLLPDRARTLWIALR